MPVRPRAFFRSSTLMLPGVLIGAIYTPGFSDNRTSWRLVIDDAGHLYQHIRISTAENGYSGVLRQAHVLIGQSAALDILLQAEAIGFASFREKPTGIVDDASILTLTVRFDMIEKTVISYEINLSFEEYEQQQHHFMQLWHVIHSYAPVLA